MSCDIDTIEDERLKPYWIPVEDDEITDILKEKEPHFRKYRATRRKFALTEKQRIELLEYPIYKKKRRNTTHYLMMRVGFECGFRVGEIVNLPIKHLFLTGDMPMISIAIIKKGDGLVAWKPKTPSGIRTIQITKDLAHALLLHIGTRTEGYVFISQKKWKFTERQMRRFVNEGALICKTIGFTIGTHTLRRTFASFQIKSGKDLGALSKELGHASIKMTIRYLYEIEDVEEKQKTANNANKMHNVKGNVINKMIKEGKKI